MILFLFLGATALVVSLVIAAIVIVLEWRDAPPTDPYHCKIALRRHERDDS